MDDKLSDLRPGRMRVLVATAVAVAALLVSGCAAEPLGATDSPSSGALASPTGVASSAATGAAEPTVPTEGSGVSPSEHTGGDEPTLPPGQPYVLTIITLEDTGDSVQATGIVAGLVESSGRCTLSVTRGDVKREISSPASPSRDSVYCGLVTVPTEGLEAGDWVATLTYVSARTVVAPASATIRIS